jgi:glyoxylase-like metal-dependent hydrolase (beta-lactamase superfamily II)
MISDDFNVTQISTKCLSQFGYFIQAGNECAIIDPLRDLAVVKDLILESGCKLKYIILTHFHADFVAGHFDLQKLFGGIILMGPSEEQINGVSLISRFDKSKIRKNTH